MTAEESLEQLFDHLHTINRAIRSGAHIEGVAPITRVQWMILRHLHHKPGSTIGELAQRLDVKPSTMSQMLDRLEKVNLISRSKSAEDSRIRHVSLTATAEGMMHTMWAASRSRLQNAFDQFAPDEQQHLLTLLGRLAGNVTNG
ncbi:MarR family winged helix-turn-helix transcriptional regulator [Alicyclobacillus fodiniaquatilis]|uniref:MarR family winged helix-turn-helix transcriptional regulator n=1 Tax=Alicyclobacillus fodiniaquatilis TaxID=1661150 RepID=A0ABW4JNB4_9BACL